MAGLQQGSRVSLSIGGLSFGYWMTKSGGVISGEPVKSRSGGSRVEKVYKVLPTYSDVTLTRNYDNDIHAVVVLPLISIAAAGGSPASITEQQLDADDNDFGSPVTYSGMFYSFDPGDFDVESTEVRKITAMLSITGVTS